MPRTAVVFYAEGNVSPFLEWLDRQSEAVQNKLIARIELLEARGYEMRRPHADLLRDGIYELRIVSQRVNYRALYFYYAGVAVVSHCFSKEAAVPLREIGIAIGRRERYALAPGAHTYRAEES